MFRRLLPLLLATALAAGCAGSSKLSQKSEEKLASGDAWKAWQLATRALDKEPGNPRAQQAATAAGTAIVQEWQRKIHSLAELDSLNAAEEVLKLAEFRLNAAHYATIGVGPQWPAEESALRRAAARVHYQAGLDAATSKRPKRACIEFSEASRFVSDYRDVGRRIDRTLADATTRVAVAPFRTTSEDPAFGAQVAQAWQDALADEMTPPAAQFTKVLGGDAIRRSMTVDELDDLSRKDAVRMGRRMGAQRVVWGTVGPVKSSTQFHIFRDSVYHRITDRDREGHEVTRWIEVPIEVVSRTRDVTAGVDYEIIETTSGTSLVHRRVDRASSARVVWTSYQPEGDPASYALVSEEVRASNPDRARDVEKRWVSVCGTAVTLAQVLEERKRSGSAGQSARDAAKRIAAGAAFVFLQELPPAEDLALAALQHGSAPLRDDLIQLDPVDDVDLGTTDEPNGDR